MPILWERTVSKELPMTSMLLMHPAHQNVKMLYSSTKTLAHASKKQNVISYANQGLILTQDLSVNANGLQTLKSYTSMNLANNVELTQIFLEAMVQYNVLTKSFKAFSAIKTLQDNLKRRLVLISTKFK